LVTSSTLTEAAWLTSDNAKALLRSLPSLCRRKVQLYGCACCRRLWERIAKPRRDALEVAEQFADGLTTYDELQRARGAASEQAVSRARTESLELMWTVTTVLSFADVALDPDGVTLPWAAAATSDVPAEWRAQADLVRCIFGNPHRSTPEIPDPAWLTSDVLALAAHIYEARDFSVTPILADALQDAGCEDAEVLNHCREGRVHARGCWVVDLVLGKE
jgi:hypothetical protein